MSAHKVCSAMLSLASNSHPVVAHPLGRKSRLQSVMRGIFPWLQTSPVARLLIVAFGVLILCAASHAQSISFVQETQCKATGTSVTCAFSSPVTAGDALMVMIAPENSSGSAYTISVFDNLNGAWTQNGSTCFSPYNAQAETLYFLGSAAGSITVTITSSTSTEIYATIAEYSGIATSGAVDAPASCTYASGTTVTTPSVTTTNANDLILASPAVPGNDGTITVGSPYTIVGSQAVERIALADQIVTSAGTYNGATFTTQYSNPAYGVIATYKAAQSGSPVSVSISPTSASLQEDESATFTATVTNTTNTAVTWSISPADTGTITTGGIYTAPATISAPETVTVTATSQADTTKSASATVSLYPPVTITWPTPAAINAGTALSSTQLDATANVPGTFAYTPAAGTVPAAGTDALSVLFTPTDTTDYSTAVATVWLPVNGPAPIITTVAGTGTAGYSGDGGSATSAALYGPAGITFDSAGSYYISDNYNNRIREVNASTGVITTVAGNGVYGYSGDGGPATSAELRGTGMAFDAAGDIYIADAGNNVIRKVTASTGIITTVVGNGTAGYSGDGGPATSAELNDPGSIAFDSAGDLYIADTGNYVIREVNASTGIITTVAGNGVGGYAGDGGPATGAEFDSTGAIEFDSKGNLYISDQYNSVIREVNISSGVITTVAGGGPTGYIGDGGPATSANFGWTEGFAIDPSGNLYIADKNNGLIRKVTASTGIITSVAGNGVEGYSGDEGPATSAELQWPAGVAIGPHGNLYVADFGNNRIRRVNLTATITWPTPAAISYGTALSSTQLDATANVPGTFVYTPAAGTVLPVGQNTLSVTFTPTDTTDYQPVTQTVTLTVDSVTVADSGTITLTVNGMTAATTTYGAGSTPASVAAGLASGVTSNSPVTITAAGDELDLQSKTGGSSTDYSYTLETTSYDSSVFSQPSFMYPDAEGYLSGGANQNSTGATIYTYCMPSSTNSNCPSSTVNGYDADGNVTAVIDSVMGTWAYGYDNLNRLATGGVTPAVDSDTYFCWSYDNFGNRQQQMGSNEGISGGGESTCTQQSGSNVNLAWADYSSSSNNQMTTTVQAPGGVSYDAAGDITSDGNTLYLYNADGQICAVQQQYLGMTIMMGYIYDADGERVAKGTISTWSCDPSVNGFSATANYVRDQAGRQLSEFAPGANGSVALVHTNVYVAGELMATYDPANVHFYLNDWLGTRRVQTDYAGVVEQDCASLPYGDSETCTPVPTENLYTGKERDQETAGGVSPFGANQGNDYFGARYYGSSMGRWLSPDPSGLAYADPTNPQSMNLYGYVEDNPMIFIDPSGLWLVLNCAADTETNTESDTAGEHIVEVHADLGKCSVTDDGGGQYNGFISQLPTPQDHFQLQAMNFAANYACQLVAPGGAFNVGPNAVALFQPPMASALTNAFNSLNQQGITPFINSGYRSPADQMRMRNGGSGPNPAAPVSWHEAGMAVDINGTTSSYFPTIVNAMEAQGLTWGGTFRHRDPPHFQLPPAGTRPSAAMVNSCAGAAGGGS